MRSGWVGLGAGLGAAAIVAILASRAFAVGEPSAAMPILAFAVAFAGIGLAFLAALPLVSRSEHLAPADTRRLLVAIFLAGLAARAALLASEPILEVDFNRYLWDGGLVANGFNPYSIAPARIGDLPYDDVRLELSKAAAGVFDRISYPELKTIYPPVAQATFALAHILAPWSLAAWRTVAIAGDTATFALLVALLGAAGRSPLWAALYWWCPLVIKEIANSAHMEAILGPLVLGALLLSVRGRHFAAAAVLGLAVATKLWPIMLAPLILRSLAREPIRLAAAITALGGIAAGAALPVWLGGLDQTSGFVSFADYWATNSALFPLLERLMAMLLASPPGSLLPGRILRALSALAVLTLAVGLSRGPIVDARDLVRRAYLVVTALVLLSPAQFPWYVLWVLPLACLRPGIGWHVAAALLPLYYSAFHFRLTGAFATYETVIVWLIWVPVWLALVHDALQGCPGASRQPAGN